MTNYYTKKGNRIIKYAYLSFIRDFMISHAVAVVHMDEGYENDAQRIRFSTCGRKCLLDGINCPNTERGILPMTVTTEWMDKPNQRVDIDLNIGDIHIKTLERIAEEVHSLLWIPEKDGEWDVYKQGYISDYLDTYLAR